MKKKGDDRIKGGKKRRKASWTDEHAGAGLP